MAYQNEREAVARKHLEAFRDLSPSIQQAS